MLRTDLFLKVHVDHDPEEPPEQLAEEICRAILRIYGVRSAELSSFATQIGRAHV